MKILIHQSQKNDITEYYIGMAQAIAYCDFKTAIWNKKAKPTFDIFDEFNPDLLIIDNEDYDDAVQKCLNERPMCKIAVRENTDKKHDISFSENVGNIVITKAANILNYEYPEYNKMFDCDYLYIGAWHPKLDEIYSKGYSLKFFGEKRRVEYSLGNISKDKIQDAIFSARKFLHIHESKTSQKLYEIIYCMGLPQSTKTESDIKIFGENCPFICWEGSESKEKNVETQKSGRLWVYNNHTYFDRVKKLFQELNLPTDKIDQGKNKYGNERLGL